MSPPEMIEAAPSRRVTTTAAVVAGVVVASSAVLAWRVLRAGYGADNDTFLMLGTWDVLADSGRYVPSRYQGYPVAEVIIGAAQSVGGHWASGLVALAFGLGCIAVLDQLLRRRTDDVSTRVLLLSVVVAAPAFVIASSTSVDYVFGLFFFLLGWMLVERPSRPWPILALGSAALVLAAGVRITYLPAGVILLLAMGWMSRGRRVALAGACVVASIVWYLPAWRHHRDLSALLTADRPTGQGVGGFIARAGADGLDLLGVVGSIALCATWFLAVRQRRERIAEPGLEVWAIPALAAYYAVMWVMVPVEPAYLLPLLAVVAVGAAPARGAHALLVVAAIGTLVHGWVVVEPYRVEYANRYGEDSCELTEATGAQLALEVSAGELLDYPNRVASTTACNEALRRSFVQQWTD